ncbi:hypothetical protein FWC31_03475 [Candidatus Saccharibacteria bacterium]|nr:hypothetical protein [Candidatus Saccharibacteria bacterium]
MSELGSSGFDGNGLSSGEFGEYSFDSETMNHPEVGDKWVEDHPKDRKTAEEGMKEAVELLIEAFEAGVDDLSDPRKNRASKRALERAPSLPQWLQHRGSDDGLFIMYYPEEEELVPGILLPEDLKPWQCLQIGIALRERAQFVHNDTMRKIKEHHAAGKGQFTQLVVASGNGRHALRTLKEALDLGYDCRTVLLDNNPEALLRANEYAIEMGVADYCQIIEGDLFSREGILAGKIGAKAISSTNITRDLVPINSPLISYANIPAIFSQILDIGGTGCYAMEDEWVQNGDISSFIPQPMGLKLAGQKTLKRNMLELLSPGGSLLSDSVNLVHPEHPEKGIMPLIPYLEYVLRWKGLVPTTVCGIQGLEGESILEKTKANMPGLEKIVSHWLEKEFGILPMIEGANLSDLVKVTAHNIPSGGFTIYEYKKSESELPKAA